jgi:signal peptidase I
MDVGTEAGRETDGVMDETGRQQESPERGRSAVEGAGGPKPASSGGGVRSWLRDTAISIIVSTFVIVFLYQPVRVEGTSMLPMLEDQDRLFINKIAYRVGEIHRGDVVVFLYPRDHQKSYIKRVIALPGDDLRIDHGRVYVNGSRVVERYVPPRYADERSQSETIVPRNEYFVMGDHRSISSDSRDFGPVERSLIYGKAAFVYWPLDQAGVVR